MGIKRELREKPLLIVNYKVYTSAFGSRGLKIAVAAEKVYKKLGRNILIIVAPPATELRLISEQVSIPVFAQHADPINLGANTGYLPLELIKDTGAAGVMLNHSEHRLKLSEIERGIVKALEVDLTTLVCASTPRVAGAVAMLKPDIIAVEPPELIGTGVAVSKAKPEVISDTVRIIRQVNTEIVILTGAGISRAEDVGAAIRLGTTGVLVASAIMKSENPEKVITEMAEAAIKEYYKRG
ncbi:MAG: triose-phosphate isomerase [Desulfurococcales archaeon]|nr:triose-phosphate isomerase [Desulfurococcales archaeon]